MLEDYWCKRQPANIHELADSCITLVLSNIAIETLSKPSISHFTSSAKDVTSRFCISESKRIYLYSGDLLLVSLSTTVLRSSIFGSASNFSIYEMNQ